MCLRDRYAKKIDWIEFPNPSSGSSAVRVIFTRITEYYYRLVFDNFTLRHKSNPIRIRNIAKKV